MRIITLLIIDIIITKAPIKSGTVTDNLHTLPHLILKTKIQDKEARSRTEIFSLAYIGKHFKNNTLGIGVYIRTIR